MNNVIPKDWIKISRETSQYLRQNLNITSMECYDVGEWYEAEGYGRMFFRTLRGEWYCHPRFLKP